MHVIVVDRYYHMVGRHLKEGEPMETAEMRRFFDYVTRTSRIDAQERRRSMHRPLSGHACRNIKALVAAVDGNTRDQAWASQAVKDGEIVRLPSGALAMPDPRKAPPQADEWLAELERVVKQGLLFEADAEWHFELACELDELVQSRKLTQGQTGSGEDNDNDE